MAAHIYEEDDEEMEEENSKDNWDFIIYKYILIGKI